MPAPSAKRMRSCHNGKKRFQTMKEAQAAAAAFMRRKAKGPNPVVSWVNAYGCACGGFHIGKSRDINWALLDKLAKPKTLADAAPSKRLATETVTRN